MRGHEFTSDTAKAGVVASHIEVFDAFDGSKVVVRTLDAGSDKPLAFATMPDEPNPSLGVRGVRIAFDDDGVLTRQLDAFGAPATTAQQRRLDERGAVAPAPPSLEAAADDLAHLARSTEDERLTADLASVAASWWAGAANGHGVDALGPRATPQEAAQAAEQDAEDAGGPVTAQEDACASGLTAAVTAVDRSLFTAEAVAARKGSQAGSARELVDGAAALHRTALSDPRVAPVLECEPPPVVGHHELPPGVQQDPVRALGRAEREARDALVRAAASSSGEQRTWVLDALRTAARAGQVLDPEQPVPALPGRP